MCEENFSIKTSTTSTIFISRMFTCSVLREMKFRTFMHKVKTFFRNKRKKSQIRFIEMQKGVDSLRDQAHLKRETDGDGGFTPP